MSSNAVKCLFLQQQPQCHRHIVNIIQIQYLFLVDYPLLTSEMTKCHCAPPLFSLRRTRIFFSQSDTSLSSTIESNSERAVGLYRMQFLSNDSSRIPSISIGLQRASGDLLELQQLGDRSRRPCRPPGAARRTQFFETVRPSVTHGLKEKTCQIAAGQRQIAGQFTNEAENIGKFTSV